MKKVNCIKSIKTKKGLKFIKGNFYDFAIYQNYIRVYFNKFESVIIKNESVFNRYFM